MPAPSSCDEFLDALREARIVDEQALGPFLEQWHQTSPQSNDIDQFADSMHKAGLITSFQKGSLLQGKKRGYIIADKYILLEPIGAGGMGSVWLCQHKVMHRRVAIKVLPTAFAKDPEYLARFHRESRAAAALDHPNIVRAFDVDQDDKMHFLVMEYVDGCSFQDKVVNSGPLEIQQAANYISQAAAGLQHAHEAGLVHRDIKPGNLLVDRKGTVKILDMGLALFFQEQGKSLTQQYDANAVLGTAEYLAPEQAIDSHGVDIRADIYSLGLTFFFMLTGKSPYGDEGTVAQKLIWHQLRAPKPVRELRPEVPEGLAAIITKMLAKDRAERYQTPDDVVKALAPWVQGTAQTEPAVEHEVKDAGRGKKGSATTIVKKGPETIRASELDTVVEANEESAGSEVRAKKKSKFDSPAPESKRKLNKSDKNGEDSEVRTKSKKKADGSGKHRREKTEASGFWTLPRIIMAGVGGFAILGVTMLLVVLTLMDRPSPSRVPGVVAQVPKQNPPVEDKKLPSKEPEKKVEPPKKDPIKPPPVIEPKKVDPPLKEKEKTPVVEPKKVDPPKKEDKTDPAKKEPPPPDPKTTPPPGTKESLAEFFPKAGATLFYNVANYASKAVLRQKWEFTDKGVINVTNLQLGLMEKDTLLKNGAVKWLKPFPGKDQVFFRTTKTHIEMGQMMPQTKTMLWEPVLPLSAGVKDTWKSQLPNGDYKEFVVEKFDTYKGKRAVIIRESIAAPQGGRFVTEHTYVLGIGEVTKSQSLENMPSPPLLVMEAKLVEN